MQNMEQLLKNRLKIDSIKEITRWEERNESKQISEMVSLDMLMPENLIDPKFAEVFDLGG